MAYAPVYQSRIRYNLYITPNQIYLKALNFETDLNLSNKPFLLKSQFNFSVAWISASPSKLVMVFTWTHHGLHGSAGTVLTAITLSYGKWRNSTPHRIKTPSLVDMKLWTYDYVREICPQIYFCKNPCSGGFWQEWRNITSQFFLYIDLFLGIV